MNNKIGFGGGCHWCTEAVFQSLHGVEKVEQGWIDSEPPYNYPSEAMIVHYNETILLADLIAIHLLTHSSTKQHSMRGKYRSAVYYFNSDDEKRIATILEELKKQDLQNYITLNLKFVGFTQNKEMQLNYYLKNKKAPFCTAYISPKLTALRAKYGAKVKNDF
ncbi:peptide-methionine (S)-S-oxide reductase [Flavobacterium agricola]|uniref:peptide-methionine (S)-S-oxide reductase n=1 Tax=Flavobacterium agricola TaxID=2870839 RepID=A0ABY6LWC4_9FLAO|nr:peptide-methionine (S)-S-oxide reductase [Flavobacterium agricola]UYW00466.1 peptide-methionine (S)-S-oxide reductase [Flavobacterium agricola]